MDFDTSDCTIGEAHSGNAFHLPPLPGTVDPAQTAQFADASTDGDRPLLGDLAKDFKWHWGFLAEEPVAVPLTANLGSHAHGEFV